MNKEAAKKYFLIAVPAALLMLVMPASADTDYRCLNLCVEGGKTGLSCFTQCSEADASSGSISSVPSPKKKEAFPNHRILPPLHQGDNNYVLPNLKPVSSFRKTKNYKCVAKCLQNHMQYQTCDEDCTTVTAKNRQIISSRSEENPKARLPPSPPSLGMPPSSEKPQE